jgi:hypothetical protein
MGKTWQPVSSLACATVPDKLLLTMRMCFMQEARREVVSEPPRFGGGMFANILPGGDVCRLLAKIQPKAGKHSFVCKIQYLVSKIH